MLGPMDPRDVIYTKTRFRTPLTDQSLRRPPHHKKCMHTANCFIGRHLGTGSTFIMGLCLLEPYDGAWLKDIWDHSGHYVCCP
ncbi:uncharacterized protein TNCV_3640031 [Trichonephila clavipes]|nr:uncharacterized protein TNCV_3640031 [Trichonephila clavipes]